MKLVCSVSIGNRLLPSLSISAKQKHVKSTIALCKTPSSHDHCIILFTNQNKTGTKYGVKDNISKILTRFINDGKATIQFKMPPHDLYLQADVIQLKSFLHLLKRVLENKVSPKEMSCSSLAVTPGKDMGVKKLVIRGRSEYPAKGFPRTLETLHIVGINRCSLDRGILRLSKLKVLNLSENSIECLPEELNALRLAELNLAHNSLGKSTGKQWGWMGGSLATTLTTLSLESNQLKYLPAQVIKLHKLDTLKISHNELRGLPRGIGCMTNLKRLIASHNSLSDLPGSITKCRFALLDLFNNDLKSHWDRGERHGPKNLGVYTLKECAGRRVLQLRLRYSAATIPLTLVAYLDDAKYCVCGGACFFHFIRAPLSCDLSNIAQEFVISTGAPAAVALDCFFCSAACFRASQVVRSRNRVI